MALAVYKSYLAGEVLFASDLNLSISTIHDNPISLISPFTGSVDAGGFDVTNLDELEFDNAAADPTASATPRVRNNAGTLKVRVEDARTATIARPLGVTATTSGTPAASIGVGVAFEAESVDEAPSVFGAIDFVASDVTAGSEDTYLSIQLRVAGRALDEKYRFSSTAGEGFAALFTHAVTADRTYTFPDRDVTIEEVVRKTADQIVANNTTTLANVTGLSFALGATEVVVFRATVLYSAAAAADAKFGWTGPASATMKWSQPDNMTVNVSAAVAVFFPMADIGGVVEVVANGASAAQTMNITLVGRVTGVGTAGTVQLQAAQSAADVSDMVVYANSVIEIIGRY